MCKKSVCKLCDDNVGGCIEFYRPHEVILAEVKNDIEDYAYNKETNTLKAQGMLNTLIMIDERMGGE